jgi:hypothetical protein
MLHFCKSGVPRQPTTTNGRFLAVQSNLAALIDGINVALPHLKTLH